MPGTLLFVRSVTIIFVHNACNILCLKRIFLNATLTIRYIRLTKYSARSRIKKIASDFYTRNDVLVRSSGVRNSFEHAGAA